VSKREITLGFSKTDRDLCEPVIDQRNTALHTPRHAQAVGHVKTVGPKIRFAEHAGDRRLERRPQIAARERPGGRETRAGDGFAGDAVEGTLAVYESRLASRTIPTVI
jgi:hypothetical protein